MKVFQLNYNIINPQLDSTSWYFKNILSKCGVFPSKYISHFLYFNSPHRRQKEEALFGCTKCKNIILGLNKHPDINIDIIA